MNTDSHAKGNGNTNLPKSSKDKLKEIRVAVSATFTSEPIKDYIKWWGKQFGYSIEVKFADYNQVFQELADERSLISTNEGVNLILVRFEDWLRALGNISDIKKVGKLEEFYDELIQLLGAKPKLGPYFVGIFPVSTHLSLSSDLMDYLEEMNQRWREELEKMENIFIIDFQPLRERYRCEKVFDPLTDREGHLPFTGEYYAVMGTTITRTICTYIENDFKEDSGELLENNRLLPMEDYTAQDLQLLLAKVEDETVPSVGDNAPSTEIERKIADIWEKVLRKRSPGINYSFFTLGGDSLKAVTLISEIFKVFNVELSMNSIFENKSIKEMSTLVSGAKTSNYFPIEPVVPKGHYPLSSAQMRLYILHQMDPDSVNYNIPKLYLLEEELDDIRIENSFRKLIQRHEIFRTSFHLVENQPVQRVHESVDFRIQYYDLTLLTDGVGKNKLLSENDRLNLKINEIMSYFVQPFDLLQPPLIRSGIIRVDDGKYFLMVDMHHIISDGISYEIFKKELMNFYESKELLPLKIQYKDYAVWQGEEVIKKRLMQQKKYWIKVFEEEVQVLNLPLDYERPLIQSFEGKTITFGINNEKILALKKLARNGESTLFMVLSAIFCCLLGRLSGNEDIVIGTPVGGRRHPDVEGLIGMFVNTLTLRSFPSGEKTFTGFLKELRGITLDAFENQEYPFDVLVDILDIKRDTSRNPLFDVVFALQNMEEINFYKQKKIHPYKFRGNTSKFDMSLIAEIIDDGLSIDIEYCTRLFIDKTIQRFISYFKNAVSDVINTPEKRISEIEIITIEEKREILYEFNDTKVVYPRETTIHEMFEINVKKNPHKIVLVYNDIMISYTELNARANRLGNYLYKGKQIKLEEPIGILMDRSPDIIIAIMGILKAGGVYLTLVPSLPIERIRFMISDTNMGTILSRKGHIEILNKLQKECENFHTYVCFDNFDIGSKEIQRYLGKNQEDLNAMAKYSAEPVHRRIVSNNQAYVIYTSGTTGMPKGVVVGHRSIVNLCCWHNRYYNVTENDNASQYAAFSFDASVWEIFPYLVIGATLHIFSEEIKLDIDKLNDYFERNKITIAFLPTQFCELFMKKQNRSLRIMLTGGDKLRLFIKGGYHLYNNYGPTENTVVTTSYRLKCHSDNIPIGKPVDNNIIYILDKKGRNLMPIGVAGELCIGGESLALGYLNRPELTAEKFARNPFDHRERIYITGDIVKWLSDGNIEYLGRIDQQVKIRGFRIEIGEIESKILKQQVQKIKDAVVIVKEDNSGEKFLCAYVVTDKKIDISLLQTTLSRDLPEYMIPSYFLQIKKVPLTPNGKIDRKALPTPEIKDKSAQYVAPRNDIEENLVEIWAELLHLRKEVIGIDDNFFKMGGHSLKAAVMITKIHKTMNTKVQMHQIFNMSTIRKLAEYINEAKQEFYSSIEAVEEKEYYPQTSSQKRLYFIDRLAENSILYNIQLMDIYCKGIDKENLREAFKKLIKRHESLRTSFFTMEGEALQRIHKYENIIQQFDIEYWETSEEGMIYSEEPGKEWTKVTGLLFHDVVEDFVKPFNLSQPPLIRVGLIKIWGKTQILMLDIHHIAADGISLIVLIKDLWALFDEGELPSLRIRYKDFSQWSHNDKQQQMIKNQEKFWLKEFEGELPVLNLPYDYPRPARMTFGGDMLHFEINEEETRKLNELVRKQGETLYMILLAAFYVMLAKLSGQEEIIIGTVSAGRNHDDIQPVIGMFVETLAIRSYPKSEKTFKNFLAEVKEKTIQTFENQNYPFEQLVSKVSVRQDKSRNPLFDVVFTLDNEAELSNEYLLEVLMLDRSNPYMIKRSKFDMTLMGAEIGESLQFNLEYNKQLFKEKTIERFIIYFNKIISSICRNIEQKIADIDILPDLERGLLLYAFNDTESEYPKNKTINELFEEVAAKYPDNTAVVGMTLCAEHKAHNAGDLERLTYAELNARTNRLAQVLRAKGLKRDEIAAIMIEPCQEMIIAMISILKAGGAFLPIDHKLPKDRIKYILEESGTEFLLTHNDFIEGLIYGGDIIALNNASTFIGTDENPQEINESRDLAYIIYTSGSTGKPKGVMIEHRTLINLCFFFNAHFSITSFDKATKFAGFSFDASIWEVFPPMIVGAALYIIPERIKTDITELSRYYEVNGITCSFLPTQMCEQFMTIDSPSLKVVTTGGDKLKSFTKRNYKMYNCYGPTENTVCATTYLVTKLSTNIPIGKPIYNNQMYILDKNDYLQPIGVPGELCIGGDSLARGYLNNPQLTREKFIDSPFKYLTPWAYYPKLYRTGDLARWLNDGNIEFLGRIDYQVKIRGFRIELGEIENRLLHIENIKEAVVMAREDFSGQKFLCAYIVSDEIIDEEVLEEMLSKNLPEYMIPSYFIRVEKMPLNPSGKIDTKALPAPEVKGVEYADPTSEAEKRIARIWSQVLGIEKIGIDDNFFKIGGDSIKTIQISGRLKKYGFQMHVNDFFQNPTIRELANLLKKMQKEDEKKAVARDEKVISMLITQDYEKYLEQVKQERWPNLTVENLYQHIMLTGATGYLGAYLLSDLLTHTPAVLYLPVRGNSREEAQHRFKQKFVFYFGEDFYQKYKNRMMVLRSDLREERLGIEKSQYEKLSGIVEAVIHSAANVKHYGLYKDLFKDNVVTTERLLEFSLEKTKKDFHFISTVDTGRGDIPGKDYLVFTEYLHDAGQESKNIYVKSKLEAEKRVLAFREKGLEASIYRAGNMTFHSETGQFQENIENNAFYAFMRGIIKVGYLSGNMKKMEFDMSFVNYSARAIAMLVTRKNLKNETYHISNPKKLPMREMELFLKELGMEIYEWKDAKDYLSKFEGNIEYEKIIERVKLDSWAWEEKPATLTVPKSDRTVILLEKLGFQWPKVTKEHIEKMISHCKKVGFL